jgi:hypothetical protein
MGPRVEELFVMGGKLLEEQSHIDRTWRAAHSRIDSFAIRSLTNSLRGRPEPLVDHRAMMESSLYSNFTVDDIASVIGKEKSWDMKKETEDINKILAEKKEELKRMFQNYAQHDASDASVSLLNFSEYMAFIKDSTLTTHVKAFTKTGAEALFQKVVAE